ncbi:PepSY domain-containing protein [Streptomyces sp. NPDC052012]|uniref:PepSY domain-containing protein n=1 Tax=Streptomyces sp. NPDC052012 TaxID=3155051 RepID=UPI003450A020
MKRNIVIAVVTAAALVGGGTATALAVSGDDDAPTTTRAAETRGSDSDDDGADQDDRDDRDDRGDDDHRDDRDDRDEARVAASGDVTAAEAIAAALKHTPGTVVSADLDDDEDDGGKAAWEVDVLGKGDTWHSVRIDPGSGKVLSAHEDDEDDAAEVRAALKGASVSAEEAAKAAAAKGTVTSVDLDDDDEKGWEVETASAGDWKVDLTDAKVTSDRDDSDDD